MQTDFTQRTHRTGIFALIFIASLFLACSSGNEPRHSSHQAVDIKTENPEVTITVLGNVQDAGSPQIGCQKSCCSHLFDTPDQNRKVVALGVSDAMNQLSYLFEATPDIGSQIDYLMKSDDHQGVILPDGIFLTHAHIGHYTGLMYLGVEAINSSEIPVYTAPKMSAFIRSNGPWNQLITRKNIDLKTIKPNSKLILSSNLSVSAFQVPHRDEYSETVGWKISGPDKSAIFIPDIDKWDKWDRDIISEIRNADYAFVDATFFDGNELPGRDMSQIPHPFVVESIKKFTQLEDEHKNKIYFIHLNHTNPLLDPESVQSKSVTELGYHVARFGDTFSL